MFLENNKGGVMEKDKNCVTCRYMYSHANVTIPDRNTQRTVYIWYCDKDREEFKKLVQTQDDTGFSCPEYEAK